MSAIEKIRARMDEYRDRYEVLGDHAVSVLRSEFDAAIAEAQVQALSEAADRIRPYSGIGLAHGATRGDVAVYLREWADLLTTTTEGSLDGQLRMPDL